MFEQMLLPTSGTHQARSAALAFVGQMALVAIATLVIPGLFVAQLPKPVFVTELIAPPLPPPPPPPPAAATQVHTAPATKPVPRMFNIPAVITPKPIPQNVPAIPDAAAPALADSNALAGVVGGIPGGVPGGFVGGTIGAAPAPPPVAVQTPPAAKAPEAPSQVRLGGEVEAAKLTHEVTPRYPVLAKEARITGTVQLSATIAANGTVKDLHVMSGNPLLVGAAVDAVRQWTYRPTYLNGKAVEVLTEVDVKFTLG